jgi:protein-disulfide isomerase
VPLEKVPVLGDPQATIAIIEFSDFQCPFCAQFATKTLPTLKEKYIDSGQVLLAYRHLPLTRIHPSAQVAAEVAECASKQAKFWALHNSLFVAVANGGPLDIGTVDEHARRSGLDMQRLGTCRTNEGVERVREDAALATRLGIRATPTFLVGTVRGDGQVDVKEVMSGAQQPEQFEKVLRRVMSR